MIPRIIKLDKNDKDYKCGFRWSVILEKYTLKVRTFERAFSFWKHEIKIWASKKLHFMN